MAFQSANVSCSASIPSQQDSISVRRRKRATCSQYGIHELSVPGKSAPQSRTMPDCLGHIKRNVKILAELVMAALTRRRPFHGESMHCNISTLAIGCSPDRLLPLIQVSEMLQHAGALQPIRRFCLRDLLGTWAGGVLNLQIIILLIAGAGNLTSTNVQEIYGWHINV